MKKVVYQGKQVTLADKEFLASGGQGDIYLHGGVVYKIYHDAMPADLVDKITELTVLDRPNIIRPLGVVYSAISQEPIGYTMDYADNTVGMPLLFTTSYISRNNIQLKDTEDLIASMADTTSFIHSKGILLVDGNEFNYLVDKATYKKPYFIDVDSYATQKHPATVIMPSVRDYASSGFSTLTDWYSFGVVTFQLFTGIHPYKGKHPTLKSIEDRCKHHVSVFNKDVSTPAAVRDFNSIPANYKTWYENLFEKGQRTPPPNMVSAVQMRTKRKYVSTSFNIEKVLACDSTIHSVEWIFGNQVIITEKSIYINGKQHSRHHNHSVVTASPTGVLFEAWYDTQFHYWDILRGLDHVEDYRADQWFSIEGRLYSLYENQLFEIEVRTIGSGQQLAALVIHTQPIYQQSSQIFSNVIYTNLFGISYFYIPSRKAVRIYQEVALEGFKILDAKFEKDQLLIIAIDTKGKMGQVGAAKRVRVDVEAPMHIEVTDIDIQETNVTVLSNGVSIVYDSLEDEIDISRVASEDHKIIQNAGLPHALSLVNNGTQAHYFVDDTLYKFSVK